MDRSAFCASYAPLSQATCLRNLAQETESNDGKNGMADAEVEEGAGLGYRLTGLEGGWARNALLELPLGCKGSWPAGTGERLGSKSPCDIETP